VCTLRRLAEEPVFSTDDERAYGIFRRIVIQRDPAIRQEDGQFWPLPVQIKQGFANRRFRWHLIQGLRKPGLQFIDDGPALGFSQGQPFLFGDMPGLFLHRIKTADQAQGLVGPADLAFRLDLLSFNELTTSVGLMWSST